MALLPAERVILREIRRLHARRAPLNIPAVKRSHPKLIEQVYAVRAFWGWKRALEDAGLDYAKINTELRDYVDCKICGRDLGSLAYHLISQHQVTPEEYRAEYPDAELHCEVVRAGMARRKLRKLPALPHWEAVWTPEYVLDRMAELHRRNFPMNFKWASGHEKALTDKAIRYFGSWDEALRRIGLDPARIRLFRPTWRGYSPWRRASKAAIIAELRRRKKAGEPLSWKKILPRKSGPAFLERAKKLFGSWSAALGAVGIDPSHGANSPWGKANKSEILAEIRRRKRAGESLRSKKIERGKWGEPLVRRASTLFGSWNAALLVAGIEPEGGRSRWATADKAAVLAEIRRRNSARQSLRVQKVLSEKWGRALLNRAAILFGSWTAARVAAGFNPPVNAPSPWLKADQAAIVAEIRRHKRAGESLQTTRIESGKWGHPFMRRSVSLFGSWTAALLAADVDLPAGLTSPWIKAEKTAILAEIRRRKRARESLRYGEVYREPWGAPLVKRAEMLFGSWSAALLAAGISVANQKTKPGAMSRRSK
jgi:hypothetical protein